MSLARVADNLFPTIQAAAVIQTAAIKNIFANARANGWELSDDNVEIISSYQKKLNDTRLKEQLISHFKDICDAYIGSDGTAYQAKYLRLFLQLTELFPLTLKNKTKEFYPDTPTAGVASSPAA